MPHTTEEVRATAEYAQQHDKADRKCLSWHLTQLALLIVLGTSCCLYWLRHRRPDAMLVGFCKLQLSLDLICSHGIALDTFRGSSQLAVNCC